MSDFSRQETSNKRHCEEANSRRGNLRHKAVFLDRDNTIIEDEEGYLSNPNKVKLLPGAAGAIKKLNGAGFKVIIVSNQSGIGRGLITEEQLGQVNQKMLELLAEEGAKIDAIYYCPHHPEADIEKYRMICPDRKPAPGMLIKAAVEHNIDLSKSYCVGDSERDIQAGKNAGCSTLMISEELDLKKAVEIILNNSLESYR
ncbi:MAG: HAD family hydrolase [Actinobacteria bacterium]|nr:MAG: HAD family hydrolase [Actinomycetota bacterium]